MVLPVRQVKRITSGLLISASRGRRRISAINDTKIKYINVHGKPYRVTNIDFSKLTLEASEMDGVDIYSLPADEVFNLEEFHDFHVTLRNWTGKVVYFADFLKNRKMRSEKP